MKSISFALACPLVGTLSAVTDRRISLSIDALLHHQHATLVCNTCIVCACVCVCTYISDSVSCSELLVDFVTGSLISYNDSGCHMTLLHAYLVQDCTAVLHLLRMAVARHNESHGEDEALSMSDLKLLFFDSDDLFPELREFTLELVDR